MLQSVPLIDKRKTIAYVVDRLVEARKFHGMAPLPEMGMVMHLIVLPGGWDEEFLKLVLDYLERKRAQMERI